VSGQSVACHMMMQLKSACILSRLDYCNSILADNEVINSHTATCTECCLSPGPIHVTTSLTDCASYTGFQLRSVCGRLEVVYPDAHCAHWTLSATSRRRVPNPVSSSSDRYGLRSATRAHYAKPKLTTVFGKLKLKLVF